jgi:hypothetical protein
VKTGNFIALVADPGNGLGKGIRPTVETASEAIAAVRRRRKRRNGLSEAMRGVFPLGGIGGREKHGRPLERLSRPRRGIFGPTRRGDFQASGRRRSVSDPNFTISSLFAGFFFRPEATEAVDRPENGRFRLFEEWISLRPQSKKPLFAGFSRRRGVFKTDKNERMFAVKSLQIDTIW